MQIHPYVSTHKLHEYNRNDYLERVMKSLMNFIKFYVFTLYHSIKKNLILLMIQWIIDVLITIVVTSLDVINFFRYFIT